MHWSDTVRDYYEVNPRPRWGHGKPVHPELARILDKGRASYKQLISRVACYRDLLHAIPQSVDATQPVAPFWHNEWFSGLDAASLVYFLAERNPKNYIEIGSGFSTRFARFAIERLSLMTAITSIDPEPRVEINQLCDKVIRTRLEDCNPAAFETIGSGDILFFDGSHRVFENSDVTVFFLEILPRLPPGVLVHVHDIFLPYDYIPRWNERLYSEQYLLAAMLLCGEPPFKVVLPNYFTCMDPELSLDVKEIFHGRADQNDIPFHYLNGPDVPGVSFWLETV